MIIIRTHDGKPLSAVGTAGILPGGRHGGPVAVAGIINKKIY